MPVDSYISSWKRARVDMLTPNNNRGVTYQTDEKHLTNLREYFVGVVLLVCYSINSLCDTSKMYEYRIKSLKLLKKTEIFK